MALDPEVTDALVSADSIMSLVVHRRGKNLKLTDEDIRDLTDAYQKCRKVTQRAECPDALDRSVLDCLAWKMRAKTAEALVDMLVEAVSMAAQAIIEMGGDADDTGVQALRLVKENTRQWKESLLEADRRMDP